MADIPTLKQSAESILDTPLGPRTIYRLDTLADRGNLDAMPYCVKVLLESCLRNLDGHLVSEDDVVALAGYDGSNVPQTEIPFIPGRVVLQDFTGVPAIVDLAAMRAAMQRLGGDPNKVNPLVQCDLVIDHSVQVDAYNSGMALTINSQKEFERNKERYEFLKWGQSAFNNFRVVPPATGIVHQVNLEYLAKVVWEGIVTRNGSPSTSRDGDGAEQTLYPDSLVGTDSHTTMINGLGVVGWGVGGIEAEAVMLGQPIYMLIPEVVGFKLTGALAEGCTATDLVLRVTQMLRERGVVGRFVEFFGEGLANMPLANRATIANMAPEYGATMGFFPVDEQTIKYLELTGRDEKLVQAVELYCREQGLWRDDSRQITYTDQLELDMSTVEPSLAGPKRPQDRIALSNMQKQWYTDLEDTFDFDSTTIMNNSVGGWTEEGGQPSGQVGNHPNPDSDRVEMEQADALDDSNTATAVAQAPGKLDTVAGFEGVQVKYDDQKFKLKHGDVVIAAITSCTNTSNPGVMIGAGLVAQRAHKRGLQRKPWVKTSLAPGSKVVTDYLETAGLMDDLESIGFYLVGYGCTTCIGNSGPLPDPISKAVNDHDLVVCSVLSGNRNFEGRISPDVRANYLASPPLVVAYALAGTVDIDLTSEPIGQDDEGKDVYLRDIWPTQAEIDEVISRCVSREQFIEQYANVFEGSEEWKDIETSGGALYDWNPESTYVQQPPFFTDLTPEVPQIMPVRGARCLAKLGNSVTTDHISPAGAIAKDSAAGRFLVQNDVPVSMFNSYGSRRGNDRVMVRGTFANVRVRNELANGKEGGFTKYLGPGDGEKKAAESPAGKIKPDEITTIFDAACAYGVCQTSDPIEARPDGTPLIVLAGNDYGMGSSRDWAAKGTYLLGVRAVIAESYERIHRSNLIGMGVLPLVYKEGEDAEAHKLDGTEIFDIDIPNDLKPRQEITVKARKPDSSETVEFNCIVRCDTPVEVEYYRNGGILHTVLRKMAAG